MDAMMIMMFMMMLMMMMMLKMMMRIMISRNPYHSYFPFAHEIAQDFHT